VTSTARADQFFATEVVTRTVGSQQQPAFTDPNLALGAPRGGGTTTNSIDVYCLGNGGSITLGFDDANTRRGIFNAPGFDFVVSENSFYENEDPHRAFGELMWVEVSSDGVHFARFPSWTMNQPPVGPFGTIDPYLAACFAGVKPVLANVDENAIDPFDPAAAGGDAFDLGWLTPLSITRSGVVDLDGIRFVRLVDVIGDGSSTGAFGQPIHDPTGAGIGGADVDSIAVIHGWSTSSVGAGNQMPEPSAAAALSGAAAAAFMRRYRG
jgi:hypothetical protein